MANVNVCATGESLARSRDDDILHKRLFLFLFLSVVSGAVRHSNALRDRQNDKYATQTRTARSAAHTKLRQRLAVRGTLPHKRAQVYAERKYNFMARKAPQCLKGFFVFGM